MGSRMTAPSYSTPAHLSALHLRNFRGFKKAESIPLKPLTFLVGPNSSGKTSLFDSILLLAQSRYGTHTVPGTDLRWGGPLVDLGSYEDTIHRHSTNLRMEIGLSFNPSFISLEWGRHQSPKRNTSELSVRFTLSSSKAAAAGRLTSLSVKDIRSNTVLKIQLRGVPTINILGEEFKWRTPFEGRAEMSEWITAVINRSALSGRKLPLGGKAAWIRIRDLAESHKLAFLLRSSQRVSSGRAAPKRWYPFHDPNYSAPYYLYEPTVLDAVDPALLDRTGKDMGYYDLIVSRRRKRESLASVLERLDIATEIKSEALSAYHSTIRVHDSVTGVASSLIDVGYGASQVIPVIHACLSNAGGPLFVEQPEIHLHPKAQGEIGELLASTSKYRQVIVETHSVHVVNRARIMIAKGEIKASDVLVNFVQRTPRGAYVVPIRLDDLGEFDRPWPEGFFEERLEDTMRLLALRKPSS